MGNPFSKIPGGYHDEPGVPPPPPEPEKPPPGSLCPFIGALAIPKVNPNAARLIHTPGFNPLEAIEPGISIMSCQRELCVMWDADDQDCTMKIAAQSQIDVLAVMEEIKVGLEPLANFFGGKK